MKINKTNGFLDFNQMVGLFYDGGNYVARTHNQMEVVGFIANCVAFAKYYWNENEIDILFYGYMNKSKVVEKLKAFCETFSKDNDLAVFLHIESMTSATIRWREKTPNDR